MKNIIVDDCHLLGNLFFGGGGEFGTAEPLIRKLTCILT